MGTSATLTRLSLVAAAALVLAGCNSGSSGAAGSAPDSALDSAPDSSAAQAAPEASGHPAVTCQQITFQQIQPFSGATITKDDVQFLSEGDDSGQNCTFSGDGDAAIDIEVIKGPGAAAAYAQEVGNETDGAIDVPSVGDKASRDKGGAGINALKGDIFCSTGVDNGYPPIATLELAANGTTNIGEPLYQDAAIAVGTLCNRIFGSGNTTPDLSALVSAAAIASSAASASASASNAAASAFANSPAPASS
jgi:hypothetical protein